MDRPVENEASEFDLDFSSEDEALLRDLVDAVAAAHQPSPIPVLSSSSTLAGRTRLQRSYDDDAFETDFTTYGGLGGAVVGAPHATDSGSFALRASSDSVDGAALADNDGDAFYDGQGWPLPPSTTVLFCVCIVPSR